MERNLEFEAEPESNLNEILPQITGTVEQIGSEEHWSEDLVYRISLILDEITTNIVSYAGEPPGSTPRIKIKIMAEDEDITLEVTDYGRGFDPTTEAPPPPDLTLPPEDVPIGGLGLHLVRSMTSLMSYRREKGRNHLVLQTSTGLAGI